MVKKEKDYSKGKIYKIVCNITGECYIGSTTKKYLSQRLVQHKSTYNFWLKNPTPTPHSSSFRIIERNSYDIILIENFPCNSNDELRARERYWYEQIPNINIKKPFLTDKERADYFNAEQRKYYNNNKEVISQKAKEKVQCECGSIVRKSDIADHYKTITHQEFITGKQKIRSLPSINCECGLEVTKKSLARHRRSQKHQTYLKSKVST